MRLDVCFTPGEIVPGDLTGRTAVMIDVVRASTTIVHALAAGAKSIFPVASIEEALRLANSIGRSSVLLAGERRALPIDGFDLGNSPGEFAPERVAGKTLIMATTNGTVVLAQTTTAERVLVAALANLTAVVDDLVRTGAEPVLLCSGKERQFALEDAVCAGLLVDRLTARVQTDWQLNDGAIAAVGLARQHPVGPEFLASTAAGRDVVAAGLGEDLRACAQQDSLAVVPVFHDRHITAAPAATAG